MLAWCRDWALYVLCVRTSRYFTHQLPSPNLITQTTLLRPAQALLWTSSE